MEGDLVVGNYAIPYIPMAEELSSNRQGKQTSNLVGRPRQWEGRECLSPTP